MSSLLIKAIDKLPGTRRESEGGGSPSRSPMGRSKDNPPNGRVIPPEPVQQQVHGDFSHVQSVQPLQIHNLARASKSQKALEWDLKLASDAEQYAQTLAQTGILEHSGIETQGENLYMSPGDAEFEEAVQSWMDEEKKYTGESFGQGNSKDWAFFTQCLWHSTAHVGMGKAKSKDGKTYIVARYLPAGNVQGEKPF